MAKTTKQSLTHKEYIRLKTLGIAGLIDSSIDPHVRAERYLFVNDINEVKKQRLEEYITWYLGDSDRLKNFLYTDLFHSFPLSSGSTRPPPRKAAPYLLSPSFTMISHSSS